MRRILRFQNTFSCLMKFGKMIFQQNKLKTVLFVKNNLSGESGYLRGLFLTIFVLFCIQSRAGVFHVSSVKEANVAGAAGDTVFIATGIYSETLLPKQSGEPGKYITFLPEGGDVTIKGAETGIDLDNRCYIHIKGLRIIETTGAWVSMNSANSHHNIIENCYMNGAFFWVGISMKETSYNQILNNTMIAVCPCTQECIVQGQGGPHDLVYLIDSHHNLFDGNKFYNGIHDNVDVQDHTNGSANYNIFRNNFSSNKWHANFDIWGVEYLLLENNMVVDGGESHLTNYCSRSERDIYAERNKHKGIHINTQFSIIRNNIVVNNGRGIAIVSASSDKKYRWKCDAVENRIYQNTVVGNQLGIVHNSTDPAVNNVVKNNIIFKSRQFEISIFDGTGTPSTNHFINNNILGVGEKYSLADERIDNMAVDPCFVNEINRNFQLKEDSKMIDAGTWLTVTTNSGRKSKIMNVEDVRYFTDGWGLIEGDLIQLQGQSKKVRIEKLNYDTKTLTLSEKTTWKKGAGVALPYNGNKPDLGALESQNVNKNQKKK